MKSNNTEMNNRFENKSKIMQAKMNTTNRMVTETLQQVKALININSTTNNTSINSSTNNSKKQKAETNKKD